MSSWTRKTVEGPSLTIEDSLETDNACVIEGSRHLHILQHDRREAAEVLAGDDYRVVPRDLTVGDLAQIARDAGVQLDMDLRDTTADRSRVVNVAWTADPDEGAPIHYLATETWITARTDDEGLLFTLQLPERPQTRLDLARLVAPDGWTIVPSESATNAAAMQEDLRAILDALGLGDHARPYSPHECVQRDVLPAIERLKSTANMPTWERELLAGQAAQQEIDQLKRDYDALEKQLREAEAAQPDRPEPVDPSEIGAGDRVEVVITGTVQGVGGGAVDLISDDSTGIGIIDNYSETTWRILRREPEVDEAAVEAFAGVLKWMIPGREWDYELTARELLREMAKRHMWLEVPTDG